MAFPVMVSNLNSFSLVLVHRLLRRYWDSGCDPQGLAVATGVGSGLSPEREGWSDPTFSEKMASYPLKNLCGL